MTRELIERAQGGDARAFRQLAEQSAARLWRCALSLCGDRHWAEDLSQETLVSAWRSLRRFDGRGSFSSWLHGILRHRYLKGRRQHALSRLPSVNASESLSSAETALHDSAAVTEDAQSIRNAVGCLPDEHRQVIELRFFVGATLDEIAATLDCPLGTVKSRLHHALVKLRQMNLTVNLFTLDRE